MNWKRGARVMLNRDLTDGPHYGSEGFYFRAISISRITDAQLWRWGKSNPNSRWGTRG